MFRLLRYISILMLGGRLLLLAQEADTQPAPAEPIGPAIAELPEAQGETVEPPPGDPVEKPVRKPTRRPRGGGHRDHPNALFGQDIVVKPDESIDELVLIGGSADIQGTVRRDLVMIGGSVKITGTVGGDLVVVGSSLECSGEVRRGAHAILSRATIQDGARLEEGVFFLGGPFEISPKAAIMGERIVVPFGDVIPKIDGLKAWLVKGLLWGRLLPLGVQWVWIVAGFFVGLYFFTLVLFPAAIRAIFSALEEQPVASILSGFLTLILFAPLMAILIIAVVGIPVVPFLHVGLILSLLFGKAAVMCFLGRSFGRSAGAAFLQAPLAAFFIGALILVLAYMIPIFGLLAWVLATVFGLGGAVVALSRTFQREQASVAPAPVLVGSGWVNPPGPSGTPLPAASVGVLPGSTLPAGGDTLLLPRAGFWRRFVAALLDLILLGILVPVFGKYFVLLLVAYFVTMWTWKGTTIGSLVLGLKVVRTDGRPISFAVALVRSLSSFFSALVLFLGFFWAGWDRDKQSWHDKIAGTVVVRMPRGFALV